MFNNNSEFQIQPSSKSKYRSNFGEVDVAPAKNDRVNEVEK